MASAFTHAYVALVGGRTATGRKEPARFWVAAVTLSVLPDADALLHWMGIPHQSPFGHRGFSHSLFIALAVSFVTARLLFQTRVARRGFLLFLITASHGILDAFTDGGLGVAFFWPFDNVRIFAPWRPLVVSPIGIEAFFSGWGLRVIRSEVVFVWFPLTVIFLVAWAVRRHRRHRAHSASDADPGKLSE